MVSRVSIKDRPALLRNKQRINWRMNSPTDIRMGNSRDRTERPSSVWRERLGNPHHHLEGHQKAAATTTNQLTMRISMIKKCPYEETGWHTTAAPITGKLSSQEAIRETKPHFHLGDRKHEEALPRPFHLASHKIIKSHKRARAPFVDSHIYYSATSPLWRPMRLCCVVAALKPFPNSLINFFWQGLRKGRRFPFQKVLKSKYWMACALHLTFPGRYISPNIGIRPLIVFHWAKWGI